MEELDRAQTLADVVPGQTVTVQEVGGAGALRQHLLDMGVIPGALVTFVKAAPMGDPLQFYLDGYLLTLRVDDARQVKAEPAPAEPSPGALRQVAPPVVPLPQTDHPGIGEGGERHRRSGGAQRPTIPQGQPITVALVGNQNCGKTTLFNQLTGSNQHVGNFPGVTVDRKEGQVRGHLDMTVVDLPGIYSLSPYSTEEVVSRQFVLHEHPAAIINVVDATNPVRNLYLTTQLLELGVPMVVALNMMDEVQASGGYVSVNHLEAALGVPVCPISAAKGSGVAELVDHVVHVARYQEFSGRQDLCEGQADLAPVATCLREVSAAIGPSAGEAHMPAAFAAAKLVEGDGLVDQVLGLPDQAQSKVDQAVTKMERTCGLDCAAIMARTRFSFVRRTVAACVRPPRQSREQARSQSLDRVLTGRWTAVPVFVAIMALVFVLTFNVVGPWLQSLMQLGIDALQQACASALNAAGASAVTRSLVVDGIFGGVGAVLLFLPIIVTLFFLLSMLEDTGYLARVAFVTDKALRRVGLSGRAVVPLLVAIGCTVPAVMSTRTMPSERDRKFTVVLTPYMGCSPKLAIDAFLASTFFPGHAALAMGALYLGGIAIGLLTAVVLQRTAFQGEAVPFVMELPSYRLPSLRSVFLLVWDKSRDFLKRSFTVIFAATVATWFLQSFGPGLTLVTDPSQSILALVCGTVAPALAPLGLGEWRLVCALFSGFVAKETVVSSLTVLFGGVVGLRAAMGPLEAATLATFVLLYSPCVAAIDTVRREMGIRWALAMFCYQCGLAWLVAFLVHALGLALGLG